jgi:hypothetical protein
MGMTKSPSKAARVSRTAKSAASKILGITKDGVRILKPRGKATHFTQKELRDAVARARAGRQTG